MSVKILNTSKVLSLAVFLFCSHVNFTLAQQSESLLNFKFDHLSNVQNSDLLSLDTATTNSDSLTFAQYDATWTYPWETTNFNIDLGVTLRHLSGYQNSSKNLGGAYFQTVLPLFHASALYSLPVKGLSAGIEGSHLDIDDNQVFDYRAKVSYEWRKGFGMQGGWQHQQFNLDNVTNLGADYEHNGPFIDFYLNF